MIFVVVEFDRQVFRPIPGQAVLPGGEVSGEEQPVGSDDEGHASKRLCRLNSNAAGGASAQ